MQNTQNEKENLVLPGDVIATAEEYVPGRNTMEENGDVISLAYGRLKKDEKNLTISVQTPRRKISLHSGQIVYGQIMKMDQRRATVKVGAVFDREQGLIEYVADGSIGMSSQYGRNNEPSMHIGDFIRAKILRIGDRGLDLGIFGKNLGVLRTLCTKCRLPMVKKNAALYCDNCERTEIRKVADDYGMINIMEDMA
jgi:exosome complex component CSL4